MIGLGVWQVHRGAWKAGVIAAMEARLAAPAAPFEGRPEGDVADWRFGRVRLSGRFSGDPFFVHHVRDGVAGWRVVQFCLLRDPLEATGGVYVDRGFIPGGPEGPDAPLPGDEDGEARTLEGALREATRPGFFTPPNDPEKRMLFVRDPVAMARMDSVPESARSDYLIVLHPDPDAADALVAEASVALRNNHREYSLTWFGLASALFGVYCFWHVQNRRLGWRFRK